MARTLDRTWESGFLFQLLLGYARTAHDPDWGRQFIRYESSAVVVKVYHGQVPCRSTTTPEPSSR
ncbi:hypothetical protein [Actinoallomurus iriomotensis]|uniref:Uncharacterized protein n=1 Tax=Actinoallomurus iriomotensis TaxID=478107 RepID=A0A9W6SA36_9ACTN|nr:hypothetical protein [Actinoallomurus iriomotensis]GLY89848.1 hypothetical protein Airi02_077770 [Actinoallomurus iriomotensis]